MIIIITIITIRNIIFSIWNNEPTPYKSIFFISLIRDRTKTRAEGAAGKKLAQQKKSCLFSTKGIQPSKELHKKKQINE